jgi:hypothetical protein
LTEKVSELTDFTNFGVKEKFSISTDQRQQCKTTAPLGNKKNNILKVII